ncbi:hypothetical protein RSOLAG1IB_06738 [Rhizoctonia solani AG-1 IB]|uniref:Uncharacterized protein n=1 Tax=Thanatephorus cucumeris (strain AG1-IB / isolate 7/3/14) TaxID=1108050 RepID=A0A0B7F8S5_THACB|nr:hypothetical protein RSOLAG1IB_06738 [Rhizoctonia solani AG-1 IB]
MPSYPRLSPARSSAPQTAPDSYCNDQLDKDQNCPTKCPPPRSLQDLLYGGSVDLFGATYLSSPLDTGAFNMPSLASVKGYQTSDTSTKEHIWEPPVTATASMHSHVFRPSSQPSFSTPPTIEPNNKANSRSRQSMTKKPQGASSRRPNIEDFISMVFCPREHEAYIHDYVGTDSKYTLAKNYAGMMVRSSVKSHDMRDKMHEVFQTLDAMDLFLRFLLDHGELKPEQKGCLSLRICFGALTALLGDFSQGNCVELSASDPNAPVISRNHLPRFRNYNPELTLILRRLAEKLEKSMNLYRHRRSPSCSLVAKFQEMSDTLQVWNEHLKDDTFSSPSRIASEWLRNHPQQVDNRRRNKAYSEQASPNLSDNSRTSPTNYDLNFISPMSSYTEPTHMSQGSGHSTRTDGSFSYDGESLFETGPQATAAGVTYFASTNMSTSPMSFEPTSSLYHSTNTVDQNMGFSPITNGFATFTHNPRQYPGPGPGY